jgi:hypothetical protein
MYVHCSCCGEKLDLLTLVENIDYFIVKENENDEEYFLCAECH